MTTRRITAIVHLSSGGFAHAHAVLAAGSEKATDTARSRHMPAPRAYLACVPSSNPRTVH